MKQYTVMNPLPQSSQYYYYARLYLRLKLFCANLNVHLKGLQAVFCNQTSNQEQSEWLQSKTNCKQSLLKGL